MIRKKEELLLQNIENEKEVMKREFLEEKGALIKDIQRKNKIIVQNNSEITKLKDIIHNHEETMGNVKL